MELILICKQIIPPAWTDPAQLCSAGVNQYWLFHMVESATSDKKLSEVLASPKLGEPLRFGEAFSILVSWFKTAFMTFCSQEEELRYAPKSGKPPKLKVGIFLLEKLGTSIWVRYEKGWLLGWSDEKMEKQGTCSCSLVSVGVWPNLMWGSVNGGKDVGLASPW